MGRIALFTFIFFRGRLQSNHSWQPTSLQPPTREAGLQTTRQRTRGMGTKLFWCGMFGVRGRSARVWRRRKSVFGKIGIVEMYRRRFYSKNYPSQKVGKRFLNLSTKTNFMPYSMISFYCRFLIENLIQQLGWNLKKIEIFVDFLNGKFDAPIYFTSRLEFSLVFIFQ